jgi:phosphate transport system substrate-binding protein
MFSPDDENEYVGLPVEASKTIPSYEKLISGNIDLIIVPDPSSDVIAKAENAGVELEYIPIGAEALVFITHKDNPVHNITKEQAVEIYSSMTINNWSQLGGKNGRIIPICRNADSGSQTQMDNMILEGKTIAPEIEDNFMERDMNGMVQMVEEYS